MKRLSYKVTEDATVYESGRLLGTKNGEVFQVKLHLQDMSFEITNLLTEKKVETGIAINKPQLLKLVKNTLKDLGVNFDGEARSSKNRKVTDSYTEGTVESNELSSLR